MAKARTNQERSSDAASIAMLERAEALGITTAFHRAEQLAACPIGAGQSGGRVRRDDGDHQCAQHGARLRRWRRRA
jgi:hypothetical protein